MDPIDAGLAQQVGQTIAGRWTLRRLIGSGGMAAVYAAEGPEGATAAVKLLYPEMARRRDIRERFLREAAVMARIVHPGMVTIYEQGQTPDQAYLVMELLTGETIADRVRRMGRLDPREVLVVLDQVLDVLALAHSMGVVHRDLKPENLFLTQAGRIKVLDFGLARLLDSADESFRTRTGAALGTLPYMAPEQALGRRDEVDARTDLFALGATAFRLLTGRRIHEAPSEAELLMCMASHPAPPLAKAAPDLPAEFGVVVDRALAFAKSRRYPDARTMQGDVRALLAGQPPDYAVSCWDREEFPTKAHARVPAIRTTAPLPPDSTRPLHAASQQQAPGTAEGEQRPGHPGAPAVAPTRIGSPDQTQPDSVAAAAHPRPLPATVVMPASVRQAATLADPPAVPSATIPTAPISDMALQRNRRRTLRTAVLLLLPLVAAVASGIYWIWAREPARAHSETLDSNSSATPTSAPASNSQTAPHELPLRHPANPIAPLEEASPGAPPPIVPQGKRRGRTPIATTPLGMAPSPPVVGSNAPLAGKTNLLQTAPLANLAPTSLPSVNAASASSTTSAANPATSVAVHAATHASTSKPTGAAKKTKRRSTTRH